MACVDVHVFNQMVAGDGYLKGGWRALSPMLSVGGDGVANVTTPRKTDKTHTLVNTEISKNTTSIPLRKHHMSKTPRIPQHTTFSHHRDRPDVKLRPLHLCIRSTLSGSQMNKPQCFRNIPHASIQHCLTRTELSAMRG